jgi:hypothetical protein
MGVDIAKAALAANDAVVATGRNTERVSSALGTHDDLLVVQLDITDPTDAQAAVTAALDRFGRIDVLVNNAANFYAGFFEVGGLVVTLPSGHAVGTVERRLLADLAAQAGLALDNLRLIEELKASRLRIVAAQDEERRRIERDIHDGVQQRLISLSLALRMVGTGLRSPPDDAVAGRRQSRWFRPMLDRPGDLPHTPGGADLDGAFRGALGWAGAGHQPICRWPVVPLKSHFRSSVQPAALSNWLRPLRWPPAKKC